MLEAALEFPNLDPVALRIGPFGGFGPLELRWYALAYIAGLLLGWRYIVHLVKSERLWGGAKPPMTTEQTDDLLFWATIGVIVGGRLGYVLFYMLPSEAERARLFADPLTVVRLWEGGMAFHGGLLGVALALIWFASSRKTSLLSVGDCVAAAAPIGLFFGRIANFVNGELWGRPTDVPWAMVFPYGGAEPRHPSQLYEAALEGLVLFVVLWVATHRFNALQRPGLVAGLFLVGYGLARGSLEQVREPDAHMPEALQGYVTMGLLLSVPMLLLGAWLIWRALRATPKPA